jgi:hypothetical protein
MRKRRVVYSNPWILGLAVAAVYVLFPTKVYYWDGIIFAQAIEGASRPNAALVHPNHLVYNFVGYFFYRLLRVFGADIRAVTALQILNSLLSAVCAVLFFMILKDVLRSVYFSVCLTMLFAFSATWWKFSTDANAYVPSVLFLLVSFYLVLPDRKPRPVLLALIFFVAMCFHQLAIVAYPVFALGVYLQDGSISIRRRFVNATTFTMVAAVLIVAAYALAFRFSTGSFDVARLWHWTVSYSPDAETQFKFWSNLGYSLRGHVRLFFGGRLNFLHGLVNPAIVLLIATFAVAVLLLIFTLLSNAASLKRRWRESWLAPRQKTVFLLALLWSGVYLVFLFFWLPQNTFYRLFYLPALILLLGLALSALSRSEVPRTYLTALFVAAVGLANFLFLIYPFSHIEKYPPLAFALQMQNDFYPGTVIYYASENSDLALVRYFNRQTQWKLLPARIPEHGSVSLPPSPPAWLETTAIDQLSATAEGKQWLNTHTSPDSLRELNNGAYRIRFVQLR